MRNYDKYKDILADIITQIYKTDGKNFYNKEVLTLDEEENTSDIKDISFEWLLSKWNDKEWEDRIFSLIVTNVAIDKRKEDIELSICRCADINCEHCALYNKYNWNCTRVSKAWLEDEDNLLLNVRPEKTEGECYIKSVDEMISLTKDELDSFDSFIKHVGILIMGRANEGERNAFINFEEYSLTIRKRFMGYLNDLIKILTEQGYEYEITNNHLCIYW